MKKIVLIFSIVVLIFVLVAAYIFIPIYLSPDKNYVGDLLSCRTIKYICKPGTESFYDWRGCGCRLAKNTTTPTAPNSFDNCLSNVISQLGYYEENSLEVQKCYLKWFGGDIFATLGKPFKLKVNETALLGTTGITITILDVIDTRCPKDVLCISSGNVKVTISVNKSSKHYQLVLWGDKGSEQININGYIIKLLKVDPHLASGDNMSSSGYETTLLASVANDLGQSCQSDRDCYCYSFTGAEFVKDVFGEFIKVPNKCNLEIKQCLTCYYD